MTATPTQGQIEAARKLLKEKFHCGDEDVKDGGGRYSLEVLSVVFAERDREARAKALREALDAVEEFNNDGRHSAWEAINVVADAIRALMETP